MRPTATLVGQAVCVVPGQDVQATVAQTAADWPHVVVAEERPYSLTARPLPASVRDPSQPQVAEARPELLGKESKRGPNEAGSIADDRVLSLAGNSSEKVFVAIIAAVIAAYIYFKYLT